ncbi:hypothetical protein Avbf_07017 [Armadillidium vulgare]|nr:hypothetical protein Avbf_07017 [Armadillidium vulgare]
MNTTHISYGKGKLPHPVHFPDLYTCLDSLNADKISGFGDNSNQIFFCPQKRGDKEVEELFKALEHTTEIKQVRGATYYSRIIYLLWKVTDIV